MTASGFLRCFWQGERCTSSFTVQNIRVQVHIIRPDKRASLQVNRDLSKETDIFQGRKNVATPYNLVGKIHCGFTAVSKSDRQFILVQMFYSNMVITAVTTPHSRPSRYSNYAKTLPTEWPQPL